jgi:hypothetical protein
MTQEIGLQRQPFRSKNQRPFVLEARYEAPEHPSPRAICCFAVPFAAHDRGPEHNFRADLRGRHEVPVTLSAARGTLEPEVNRADTSVHFELTYSGLATTVAVSHVHVVQPDVNGGVTVFVCGGGGTPPVRKRESSRATSPPMT